MWCLRGRRVQNGQFEIWKFRFQIRRDVPSKPRPQRRLINRQRFGVMKMPAGLLFRSATGMKYSGSLLRRNTGKIQFLERAGRHDWDLRPMLDPFWRQFARFADFAIGGVVIKLKREQFQSEFGELPIADCRLPIGNQSAQTRGEVGKFFVHAVFGHGWFSATAGSHANIKPPFRKRDCL